MVARKNEDSEKRFGKEKFFQIDHDEKTHLPSPPKPERHLVSRHPAQTNRSPGQEFSGSGNRLSSSFVQ